MSGTQLAFTGIRSAADQADRPKQVACWQLHEEKSVPSPSKYAKIVSGWGFIVVIFYLKKYSSKHLQGGPAKVKPTYIFAGNMW